VCLEPGTQLITAALHRAVAFQLCDALEIPLSHLRLAFSARSDERNPLSQLAVQLDSG
jgi:hypothetical protein